MSSDRVGQNQDDSDLLDKQRQIKTCLPPAPTQRDFVVCVRSLRPHLFLSSSKMAGPLERWLWTARPPIDHNHARGNSWKNVLTAKLWLDPNGFDNQGDMSLHQLPATTHISSRAVTADAVRCHQHLKPSPADLATSSQVWIARHATY